MSANRQIHDRREARFTPPPCPECAKPDVRVVSRTPYVLYVRCEHCFQIWSVAKPAVEPLGAATSEPRSKSR